ncbi:tyrosine-type recombinase/integrase [Devosia sp. 1566]|uniref:tyrosine-type recombinase/integrase n=1 Tax=Devosia sp. 1566 TaxID=2499144 RepID=UPI000FD8395C|nr:tyrosine-type recombinase/integrase [Devosia sp. 1566]
MQSRPIRFTAQPFTFPSTGERIVIVEGPPHGIIYEPASIYITINLRSHGLSPNTMLKQMQAVTMLLNWAVDSNLDIEQRIGTCDLFLVEEIHALKEALRMHTGNGQRRDQELVSASHYTNRVIAVRDYVAWHVQRVIQRIPASGVHRVLEARRRLDDFQRLMTSDLPAARIRERNGLSDEIQQIFLDAIVPGSLTNPFKPPYQIRNYCLLLYYHEFGLRRGEPLKIKGEDLALHGTHPILMLRDRKDEIEDPRSREPRFKTYARDLAMGSVLVSATKKWLADRSKNYPLAKRSPYLFLSRTGRPLSMNTVNDMFLLMRTKVPGLPPDFTVHHTRHNANDRFTAFAKEQGWDEATTKRNRNYMFGWAKTSDQGEKYTNRSTREDAARASMAMQDRSVRGGFAP